MDKSAVGYIRVSSEEQIKNYSLDNQKEKCEEYCKQNGYKLKLFRDEGKSATSLNRPDLINLLDHCKKNKGKIDILVIYKIDRLSRSTYDYLEIKRRLTSYGVSIVSITEPTDNSPTGEFLETLMAAQARLDNAVKSERTKDGMTKRLKAGLPTNRVAVGYKNSIIDKEKQEKSFPIRDDPRFTIMQDAGYAFLKGIYTKQGISDLLNKNGFKTRNNKPASSQFVSKWLSNPFYKGIIYSKVRNMYFPGNYEKMFTEEEWYKIQQISSGKSFTAHPKKRNHPDFPLRHFTLCSCGEHITGGWTKGRSKTYAYYSCQKHGPSIPTIDFENKFYELLLSIEPTKETISKFTSILKEKYDTKYKGLTIGVTTVKKELDELLEKRKLLVKKNMDGIYEDDLFRELDDELKNEITVKRVLITEATMDKLNIEIVCNFAEQFLQNIAKTWKNADLETKQRLQSIIFPEGVIYDNSRFRTATLSCLFEVLGDHDESNDHLG